MERLTFNIQGKPVKKTLNGRAYYAVPAAIIPDNGVLHGSNGRVMYPEEQNRKSVLAWNSKPIVLYHPSAPAADEVTLEQRQMGILLNSKHSKKKLRTECWVDIEKTRAIAPDILTRVENGDPIEVSTGLEVDFDSTPGEIDGNEYDKIALNYRPDHLAFLPDVTGAYSLAAGGGTMQLNQAVNDEVTKYVNALQLYLTSGGITDKALLENFWKGALPGYAFDLVNNEMSHDAMRSKVREQLGAKYGKPGEHWGGYIYDMYDGHVVYCAPDGSMQMHKYSVKDDKVELKGQPSKVDRVVEYRTPSGEAYAANASGGLDLKPTKETTVMAFDKAKHIAELIGNGFEESQRATLEAIPDVVLERILPVPRPDATINNLLLNTNRPVVPTPAPVITPEQYIANAPGSLRDILQGALATAQAERIQLVKNVMAYPQNLFVESDLMAAPIQNLRAIHAMIPVKPLTIHDNSVRPLVGPNATQVHNYMGAGGVNPQILQNQAPIPTETLGVPTTISAAAKTA